MCLHCSAGAYASKMARVWLKREKRRRRGGQTKGTDGRVRVWVSPCCKQCDFTGGSARPLRFVAQAHCAATRARHGLRHFMGRSNVFKFWSLGLGIKGGGGAICKTRIPFVSCSGITASRQRVHLDHFELLRKVLLLRLQQQTAARARK
jgi:hypothetical protein